MVSGAKPGVGQAVPRSPAMTQIPDFGESRGPLRPRRPHDFDEFYEGTPPWDIGRPQPALAALAAAGAFTGRVLAAARAIGLAREKARARGLTARFLVTDALDLGSLGEQFDTVVDSGLFHVFEDDDRARYVSSLSAVVRPGGRGHVLCFSEHQPGDWGPRRITQDEIRTSFAGGWRVDAIEPTRLDVVFEPGSVAAWIASLTRL